MASPVVHFEILGKDGTKLQNFYKNLFDWKIEVHEPYNYGLVAPVGPNSIGGGIGPTQEGAPALVTIYVQVNDLNAYLKKAEELGGKTLLPPTEIPGVVTIALFQDPEGNAIGMTKAQG